MTQRAKPKPSGLIRDRIVALERVPASSLVPHPLNWRVHPESQAAALRASFDRLGFVDVVLTRRTQDGALQIIDGHLRASELGDQMVPVVITDLDEQEAELMLTVLDPLAAMADRDARRLADLFAAHEARGEDLYRMVFPDFVVEPLLHGTFAPLDTVPLPEPTAPDGSLHVTFDPQQAEVITRCLDALVPEDDPAPLPRRVARGLVQLAQAYLRDTTLPPGQD